jgi:penicillin-binding protein 2
LPGFDVCGKTGTAQNPLGDDHSTFISFAPRKNPKIAIAVYVEHGVWGATAAVPIATLIEEMYLTDTITRPWLVEHVKNLNLDYSIYDRRKKK